MNNSKSIGRRTCHCTNSSFLFNLCSCELLSAVTLVARCRDLISWKVRDEEAAVTGLSEIHGEVLVTPFCPTLTKHFLMIGQPSDIGPPRGQCWSEKQPIYDKQPLTSTPFLWFSGFFLQVLFKEDNAMLKVYPSYIRRDWLSQKDIIDMLMEDL